MALLLIILIVFGGFSFLCILFFAVFNADAYFSCAFSRKNPKITGPDAASTDEIVYYWVTKVFVFCFIGFILIYLFNMIMD